MRRLRYFIYGALSGLIKRFRFYLSKQGLFYLYDYRHRKTIKMTGIGNRERGVLFYPSVHHFLHNLPSLFRKGKYDYLVAQNFLHDEFVLSQRPKVFLSLEPLPAMTEETRRNIRSEVLKPFLYLCDEPDINRRMFYPALADDRLKTISLIERNLSEKRPRLCCIINRYSERPEFNLLRERIRFVEAMGKDIDIYGADPWGGQQNKWLAFPNYCGVAEDKQKTLRNYTFVLAFENCDLPGYITEKMLDALRAGTVPLYWGGGAFVKETFPSGSYIDCRDQDPARIYRIIKDMRQEEIVSFRKAAINFLSSDAADRFTGRYLRQEILKRLEGGDRKEP